MSEGILIIIEGGDGSGKATQSQRLVERLNAEGVEAVRKGRVAAFPVQVDGRECIGIAAEIGRSVQKKFDPQVLIEELKLIIDRDNLKAD